MTNNRDIINMLEFLKARDRDNVVIVAMLEAAIKIIQRDKRS